MLSVSIKTILLSIIMLGALAPIDQLILYWKSKTEKQEETIYVV
jgi:hypothetical protein